MDIILGIKVQDSVIVATSKAFTRGISILKDKDDKTRVLTPHNLIAFTGEAGDTTQFADYIQANIQLFSMRENTELNSKSIASFIRQQLATSIRSRTPYQVQILLGGLNKGTEPFLSLLDYLGTRVDLPYCAHGYAAFYTMSLLDHHYRPDMNTEEGLKLLKLCNEELEKRMPIDFKGLYVKVIDKDGIRDIDFA
ncbi:hypothetical protein OGAPHI_005305 [Ogataea philodendri]|uniref:Proteasome subunit beta n=1 Tax=Ogataea philodendri TaxID=1378263 RepID=A0A9P8P104_9ASCO|nr:uncharacterized protein OGAPHI_005305 [Ogataea philodendri]KAH3663315.1 hypothetical protein OGAPHI_005305 [Ogataea philodendri]